MNDVIEYVRELAIQEGCDSELAEQLRKLWSSKFADTHVSDPEPVVQPASHYAQRLQNSQFASNPPVSLARPPVQPTTLSGVASLRTLVPIARPNAPLATIPMAVNTTAPAGLVIRSAVPAAPAGPRQAIVLTSALNTQTVATAVQPRLANPAFAGIAIRGPNSAAGQAAIIGQPTLTGVNGVATLHGPNVQFLQLAGQSAVMVPVQIRASNQGAAGILPAHHAQQQNFSRSQVDGAGDGESDFSDEDADLVDSYSMDTPSLRTGPMSLAQSVGSHRSGQHQTPSVPPTPSQQFSHFSAAGGGPQTVGASDDEDEFSDDGLVAATPVGSSIFNANPSSVAPTPFLGSESVPAAPDKRRGAFEASVPEKRSRRSSCGPSDDSDATGSDVGSDPEDYDREWVPNALNTD